MLSKENTRCDARRLELLLEGKLEANEELVLVDHVESCPTCQQTLEQTAGDVGWWNEAKAIYSESVLTDVNLETLHDELKHILAPTDDPEKIGRIGFYEISGVIGRGGTGIVLKAYDPSLGRFVAIKVLAPDLAHRGAARSRFMREARAVAAVSHENIISIHAVSEFQGHPYIVMQYVPGQSLDQRIKKQGQFRVAEVLRIASQIAGALAAAHKQGLVHRDVKPANILLENGIERPVVTDFGLVRVVDDATVTASGAITGTPNYMSPEQANAAPIDPRSDLFSLGSVMYAMCVGHPPFRANTILGVIRRVCDDSPRPVRESNSEIPDWLDAFINKLLAKDPDNRFASANKVEELLGGELAYFQNPTSVSLPVRDWWEHRPKTTAMLSWWIPAIATCVGIAILFSIAPNLDPNKGQADSEPRRSSIVWAEASGKGPEKSSSRWKAGFLGLKKPPKLEFRIVPNSDTSPSKPRVNVSGYQKSLRERGFQRLHDVDRAEEGIDCSMVWREIDSAEPMGLQTIEHQGGHYVLLSDGAPYSVVAEQIGNGFKEVRIEKRVRMFPQEDEDVWHVNFFVDLDQETDERLKELFRSNKNNSMAIVYNGRVKNRVDFLRNEPGSNGWHLFAKMTTQELRDMGVTLRFLGPQDAPNDNNATTSLGISDSGVLQGAKNTQTDSGGEEETDVVE